MRTLLQTASNQWFRRSRITLFAHQYSSLNYSRDETPSYEYQPLQYPKGEIRLLSFVNSSRSTSKLNINLRTVSLSEAPTYAAVSYSWGEHPILSQSVICDGKPLKITESLHRAISHISKVVQEPDSTVSKQHTPFLLWADAISINQQDTEERNDQLQVVGKIYSQAQRVFAYLGEPKKPGQEHDALRTVDLVLKNVHRLSKSEHNTSDHMQAVGIPRAEDTSWESIEHLFRQTWFGRTWILPEVVLAKEIICLFGDAVWNLNSLVEFGKIIEDYQIGDDGLKQSAETRGTGSRVQAEENIHALQLCWKGRRQYWGSNGDRPQKLTDLLYHSSERDSKDPRDQVYALLALASDTIQHHIKPNYSDSNTVAAVYKTAAAYCINNENGIDILRFAGIDRPVEGMPSWVANWINLISITLPREPHRTAGRSEPVMYLDTKNNDRLTVRGILFEPIKTIVRKVSHQSGDLNLDGEPVVKINRLVRYFRKGEPSHALGMTKTYGSEYNALDARWHVLEAYLKLNFRKVRATNADRFPYYSFRAFVSHCSEKLTEAKFHHLEKEAKEFSLTLTNIQRGRRIGWTSGHYMGVFPGSTRRGDVIAVLLGSKLPYVIRPHGNDYLLVGPAYVYGIMNGEVMKGFQDCSIGASAQGRKIRNLTLI
ncbi:hypothetical protein MMC07_000044 [Pseudocyphellaria aurata]|nr:hypothetical protein [Pseudocyphellaria aurata]